MKRFLMSAVFITSLMVATAIVFIQSEHVSSDEYGEKHSFFDLSELKYPGVVPVNNQTYEDECGSCHMAYSPGLLPSASWKRVMGSLENHFGDNAEMDPVLHNEVLGYLTDNSAEKSEYRRSKKIVRSIGSSEIVDRITDIPYFKREHSEIPQRFVLDNPKVGSFSQCDSCHLNAGKGSFNEDEVSIPGIGYWRD